MTAPLLSVVVIFHDMQREAERTLASLGAAYQTGVTADDYEVIAIDNGSSAPLASDRIAAMGPNFRYHYHETGAVSPVEAVNLGVDMARGPYVAIVVDGSRMVTPGLIASTLAALRAFAKPFVCTLAWHLGPDVQNRSITQGAMTRRPKMPCWLRWTRATTAIGCSKYPPWRNRRIWGSSVAYPMNAAGWR